MALFSRREERDSTDSAAPEPSRVASGQTGPVSRPVPAVTGPTPIVELHDSLLHTATPRYIGVIGLAATLITGVAATISSFTENGLLNMRPQIDAALVVSVGVMAFGCLWWSTFATINGRRITRGRTLGPVLPMAVYVAISVAYLAVNATVHGEARVWAWIAWLLVTFTAHSFVMVAFKSSAETIGNPTTHFTQVAMIPVMVAAATAMGIAIRVLQGIPFLAVPVLVAWMVPELYRAMHGWERACEQRMRVMLRDFSYDTPSGAVPAVAPTNAGPTPTTPQRTQVMQVTTTEPPARVAGTHHPVRPTWNPVEEARRKAELQAAMASGVMPAGAGDPSALDSYIEGAAPRRVQVPRRRHHTLIPKLLVTFWAASPLLSVPVLVFMEWQGHIEGLYSNDVKFDELGRLMLLLFGAGPTAGYFVGWLWWATASLANVRQRSLNAPWPGIVATSHWAVIGGFAMMAASQSVEAVPFVVGGYILAVVACLYCYFGVLFSLRKAAGIIGAPKESWTVLIRLPLFILGSFLLLFMVLLLSRSAVVLLIGVVLISAMVIWGWVSLIRAVWSFDRVCKAPPPPKEEAQVPLFLRHAMGAR